MSLRKSKGKTQSSQGCDWAVRDESSGRVFEFGHRTPFETFWRIIGAGEGDIWWYLGPEMKSHVALSDKEDFLKMRDIAMASWAQGNKYVQIQKAVEEDFEG